MAKRDFLLDDPARPDGAEAAQTRKRIDDALLALMAEGERINHDLVAERAGISRRTVYRYYPDRDALLQALWARLSPGLFTDQMPWSVATMVQRQRELFAGFDDNADAVTVAMASPQGRAMRNAMKDERVSAYRHALAEQTRHLPEAAQVKVAGIIQLLNSGLAWREMRDQWDMAGPDIAEACIWAIGALLRDIEQGGGPDTDLAD